MPKYLAIYLPLHRFSGAKGCADQTIVITPYPGLTGCRKVAGQSHFTHSPAEKQPAQYRMVNRGNT
jgi:hypothetical protein